MSDERDNEVEIARRRPISGGGSAPPDRDANPANPADPDGHIDAELLAAWLDDPDDLDSEQRALIDAHLPGCPACQETLAELRTIVLALAALPELEAPRSFALTPEMAAAPAPVRPVNLRETPGQPVVLTESRPWFQRQMAALRWATAVAAILFVFVVSADFVSRGPASDSTGDDDVVLTQMNAESGASDDSTLAGGAAEMQPETMADEAEQEQEQEHEKAPSDADTGSSAAGEESDLAVATEAAADDVEAAEEESDSTTMMDEDPAASTPASVAEATESSDEPASVSGAAEPTDAGDGVAGFSPTPEADADSGAGDVARDGSDTATGTDETIALAVETPADGAADEASDTLVAEDDDTSTWRLLQVGLAILIVWLLAAMIALPRLRPRRGVDSGGNQ